MSELREGGATYCPSCGAAWTPGMAYCGACGRPAEAWPHVEAHSPQVPEAPQAPVSATQAEVAPAGRPDPSAADTTPAEGELRCAWCGTANAADAERCAKCGAAFPRPEQDEAIRKASEARIRAANDSIAALQRQRARRGLGRLFGR